ncbi:uroporphyrinogen-III synthase [Sulfurospirillum sp. T05]|uniref:Uroporphyrinogen-III synthase n=1 Tax=Sulfurospirillum tamanense TaxID=2813362 RepID=A0ABS2WPZ2_9BACT|nr:uroporphyrinogen-III synthase [Sulfurospirillum tamanensis]MBN2963635.1 uroporphyrinogen-III synthase [Sulfurospirillum tamanensis]
MIYLLGTTSHPGVKHLGVIRVRFLPLSFSCDSFDAVIFTSKNAIAALEASKISWHHLPVYVIGEGTKRAAKATGARVIHVAKEAYGDAFAKEIAPHLRAKNILFPRAKEVVSDVAGVLKSAGVYVWEMVAYETVCVPCQSLELPAELSVFIFTSPSSVCCFLNCFEWKPSWQAVSIGIKTANAFPETIFSHIAPSQTVEACVSLAQELYVDLSKNPL